MAGILPHLFSCLGGSGTRKSTKFARKKSWRSHRVSPAQSTNNQKNAQNSTSKLGDCDACDGAHPTSECPHYKKPRGKHPDCKKSKGKSIGAGTGGNFTLRRARVVRQPKDGNCLFHSLNYGINGSSARLLRKNIAQFIRQNQKLTISDSPLKDWIRWSGQRRVSLYTQRMSRPGTWGGGIEMAALSRMRSINVHVYERSRGGYKRISCFDVPAASKTVHVLYTGRNHYDALVPQRA